MGKNTYQEQEPSIKNHVSCKIWESGSIWCISGKRFIIDHEQLQFDKTDGWTLIGLPEKEDGTLSDHEYFLIHDDLFDIIKSTHQDQSFLWKFLYNERTEDESQSEAIETHNDKLQNKKRRDTKYSTKHTLQRKRQKQVDYM